MRPLQITLLWVLLSMARGEVSVVSEISAELGSEFVLAVTKPLDLNSSDVSNCDELWWRYGNERYIVRSRKCNREIYNSTMKLSNIGSLIIPIVTAEHAGRYTAEVYTAKGILKHRYSYHLYVEVPVSVPVLEFSCLHDGQARISCRVDNGSHYTISLIVTGPSMTNHSSASNNIIVTVPAPHPGSVICTAKNRVSQKESNKTLDACPVLGPFQHNRLLFVKLCQVIILPLFLLGFEVSHHLWEKRSREIKTRGRQPSLPLLSVQ